jgi:hypothetical protein
MPRALKVFRSHRGFYDTVVATPSKKAALEAWGSRQDLFREGLAEITSDPDAVKAALAKPGIVLRRPFGSDEPFSENPGLPKIGGKSVAKPKPQRTAVKAKAAAAAPGRKDRDQGRKAARERKREEKAERARAAEREKALAREARRKYEAALARLDEEEERALAEIDRQRAKLAEQEESVKRVYARRRQLLRDN